VIQDPFGIDTESRHPLRPYCVILQRSLYDDECDFVDPKDPTPRPTSS